MSRMQLIAAIMLCSLAAALPPATAGAQDAPTVPPEIAAAVAAVPDFADAAAVQEALLDSGENWVELAEALTRLAVDRPVNPGACEVAADETDYTNLVWLITTAPHLDRLELTADILLENLVQARYAARDRLYKRDSDFFRRYVLNYRLDEEPVTAWRAELARRYQPAPEYRHSWDTQIASVILSVTQDFTEHERGYYGNQADPLSVDNARAGTGRELALLLAAALRAQGFGTRFVSENRSGMSWVEVFIGDPDSIAGGDWLPVYPSLPEESGNLDYAMELCDGRLTVVTAGDAFGREQVTNRYGAVCDFIPRFFRNGKAVPDFEHWSVTAWADGAYVPLDDLSYPLSADYPAVGVDSEKVYYIGAPGDYRFQCGTRYPGAVVHVQTRDFTAAPDDLITVEIDLDAPAELPPAALVERNVDWTLPGADATPREMGLHLIAIIDDAEPSLRALDLLDRYLGDERLSYAVYTPEDVDEATAAWITNELKVEGTDELPVVILVSDGATLVYRRGFDLNIADWVERALTDGAADGE